MEAQLLGLGLLVKPLDNEVGKFVTLSCPSLPADMNPGSSCGSDSLSLEVRGPHVVMLQCGTPNKSSGAWFIMNPPNDEFKYSLSMGLAYQ